MVRLSEITINQNQHILDTLISSTAYDAVELHDIVRSHTNNFVSDPLLVYTDIEIQQLLSTAISVRHYIAQEFSQDSQPYRALSHVIFYLQTKE